MLIIVLFFAFRWIFAGFTSASIKKPTPGNQDFNNNKTHAQRTSLKRVLIALNSYDRPNISHIYAM